LFTRKIPTTDVERTKRAKEAARIARSEPVARIPVAFYQGSFQQKMGCQMSNSSNAKTRLSFLRKILVTLFSAGLLSIVFSAAGICQTPGYGERPDDWAPYESGQYFEQLQEDYDHLSGL
jgi:hypothetical protein